jgi:hypothetical protein
MNRKQALGRVQSVFRRYGKVQPVERSWLRTLQSGKLYELYCLSQVVQALTRDYGYSLRLIGTMIKFKRSPGLINIGDAHFEIADQRGRVLFCLYTDVEFTTLGAGISSANDNSAYHELDLAVVNVHVAGRPSYNEIALGVECKSSPVFAKNFVREALGLRRELGLLRPPVQSTLSQAAPSGHHVDVPASPPSEYWLAFVAPKGLEYQASPRAFGIQFNHWQP